jgi:hypothetical protein
LVLKEGSPVRGKVDEQLGMQNAALPMGRKGTQIRRHFKGVDGECLASAG